MKGCYGDAEALRVKQCSASSRVRGNSRRQSQWMLTLLHVLCAALCLWFPAVLAESPWVRSSLGGGGLHRRRPGLCCCLLPLGRLPLRGCGA